jgi:hypothetical protein
MTRRKIPVISHVETRRLADHWISLPQLFAWALREGIPEGARMELGEEYGSLYLEFAWTVNKEHHFQTDTGPKCDSCRASCYGMVPCYCCQKKQSPASDKLPP